MIPEADVNLDFTGLSCPDPLQMMRNRIKDMATGQIIKVTTTDPSTSWDFPKYCQYLHHELIRQECEGGVYVYWIRKG